MAELLAMFGREEAVGERRVSDKGASELLHWLIFLLPPSLNSQIAALSTVLLLES